MFVGVDHGTTAIRFANPEGRCWALSREEASLFSADAILALILEKLGGEDIGSEEVDLIALCYSMGDGISQIMRIEDAPNRGLLSQDGAGIHVGGGTRVYEAIVQSGWPAILLPGIHRGSDIDPRFKVFSHGMSPEKVGLAYGLFRNKSSSFIVCDASSNTVSFAVLRGKIVGAIDAPIFAPGLMQGPLDVQAIRDVDSRRMTANQAFNCGGIISKMGKKSLEECSIAERAAAMESLSLFAAMEVSALMVLCRDLGEDAPDIFLAGSPAASMCRRVCKLLGRAVQPLGRCAAAEGCAWVARDVFHGEKSILGIPVQEMALRQKKG